MRKIFILFVFTLLSIVSVWGQAKWNLNMNASLYNPKSYEAYKDSKIVFRLSENGSGYNEIHRSNLRTPKRTWIYSDIGTRTYNLNDRVNRFEIFTKLERNNAGDPANGNKNQPLQSDNEKIKYKHYQFNDSQVYYTWQGYLDVYVYPKDITIEYKTGTSLILPTSDKIKIEALAGYDPEVYKWVYSKDNGVTWNTIANTSLQGRNILEVSGQDIYGANYVNQMNFGSDTWIALEYDIYKDRNNPRIIERSNYIPLTNQKSAPNIQTITPTNNKCFGASDGTLKVIFDRALISGEQLVIDYGALNPLIVTALNQDNSITITGLSQGTYTIQVSGSYNGSQMYSDGVNHRKNATITSPSEIAFSLTSSANIACFGNNSGSFQVNASGGTPVYYLNWKKQGESSFQQVQFAASSATTLNNLSAGAYDFYVSDQNNCYVRNADNSIKTKTVNLSQPVKAIEIASKPLVNPSGNGLSNGSITIESDGGTPFANNTYTVVWKNSQNQPLTTVNNSVINGKFQSTLSNIPLGTYSVEITDSKGCKLSSSYTLNQPPLLVTAIEKTHSILCKGDINGQLVAHATGGVPNILGYAYTYQWYKKTGTNYTPIPQETDSILNNIGVGQYKVEVKDGSRIQNLAQAEFTLSEPTQLTTTLSSQDVTCHGGNNGFIQIAVQGGVGNYKLYYKEASEDTYQEISVNAPNNTFLINNLIKGDYQLYIVDGNNCYAPILGSTLNTISINQPQKALEISSQQLKAPSGFGRADGSIKIQLEGGTPNTSNPLYTIVWKNEQGALINPINTIENGIFVSKIQNLPKGTYTVDIRDKNYAGQSNACYTSNSFTLSEPAPLVVSLQNTEQIYCYGETTGKLIAHAKGGIPSLSGLPYTYIWYKINDGLPAVITNQQDSIISGLSAGYYKVKIQDNSDPINVTESAVFQIVQPTLLTTTPLTRNISCSNGNDGFIRITVSGGVGSYKLFKKQIGIDNDYTQYPINTNDNTFYLNNLVAGRYSIYILDANNCYAQINGNNISEIILTQPVKPLTIVSTSLINPSGFGRSDGSISVQIEGGTPKADGHYNVVWKNSTGQVLQASNTIQNGKYSTSLLNAPDGQYSLEVKDKNFDIAYLQANATCVVSESYSLTEPEQLLSTVEESHFISCNGMSDGELIAHARGGIRSTVANSLPYKYKWYKQEGAVYTIIANETDSILRNRTAGFYKSEIEDFSRIANTTSTIYYLSQPNVLRATTTDQFVVCGQTAPVSVSVTGGTAPYRYEWNTGDTIQTLLQMNPGKYFVFITDSRGCETTAVVKIITPSDLSITGTVSHPVCYQIANGSIDVEISGGTAPYSYKWTNGASTKNLTNMKAGKYTLVVTDKEGCKFSETFTLIDPEPLVVDLGKDRTLCKGQELTLAPKVLDPNTKFNWTSTSGFKSTASVVTVNKADTYKLTITDSKGCKANDEIKIDVKDIDISSEIVVASQVFINDTIIIVNISHPEPDSIQWLIGSSDSLQVLETSAHFAKVVFKHLGHYTIGIRAHVGDCYQDILKTITATDTDYSEIDTFGESIINKFVIYPNPNSGIFKIGVELNKTSSIRLRIINTGSGLTVDNQRFDGKDEYEIPYNLSIATGTYIVVLETASGKMNLRMIVK